MSRFTSRSRAPIIAGMAMPRNGIRELKPHLYWIMVLFGVAVIAYIIVRLASDYPESRTSDWIYLAVNLGILSSLLWARHRPLR